MTWEHKMLALQALAGRETALHIRKAGNWYLRVPKVELKRGGTLESVSGNGATPEEAVLDCWQRCVDGLKPDQCLVVDAYSDGRRLTRWNGFMWEEAEGVA